MNNQKIHLSHASLRRKAWSINAFNATWLRLSKFFRNKKLWIFGCWEGTRYDDNSKYVFEYVTQHHPEITAVWITQNQEIYNQIISEGKNAVISDTREAKKIMLSAGVAFYTNGLDDFGIINYVYGTLLINLTHSVSGIKCDYYLDHVYENKIRFILKKVKDKIYDWYKFDYCIVSSEEAMKWRMSVHNNFKRNKYVMSGLPRNDVLKNRYLEEDFKNVVFFPTYRPYKNSVIKNVLESFVNDSEFMTFLRQNKIKIIVKLHNVDETSEKFDIDNENIKLLKNEEILSVQDILIHSKALITDYSSVCMDYVLTGNPVLIYAPDYNIYDKYHGITHFWKGIYKSDLIITNAELLKIELIKIFDGNNINTNKITQFLLDNYEDQSIKNTSYTKNVVDYVIKKQGG